MSSDYQSSYTEQSDAVDSDLTASIYKEGFSFKEFCETWLFFNMLTSTPDHIEGAEWIINTYFYPVFAEMPIQLLFDDEIWDFYQSLKAQFIYPFQMARIMFLMKSILDDAAENYGFTPPMISRECLILC